MSEPIGWNVYDGSTFREFIPNEKAAGSPWVHLLGATSGPAITVRDLLPRWEPPRPQFGMPLLSFEQFPVKGEPQEIPEAFRRR
jgi:hypothetical protein